MTDAATLANLDTDERKTLQRFIGNTYQRTDLTKAEKRRAVHEYVERLHGRPVASDLELRAGRARTDFDRAYHLRHYSDEVKRGEAKPPLIAAQPVSRAEPKFWLGSCVGCERDLWVSRRKPRVPLCEACRVHRARSSGGRTNKRGLVDR